MLKAFVEVTPCVQARAALRSLTTEVDLSHAQERHRLMDHIVFVIVRKRFGRVRGVDVKEEMFFVEVVGDDFGDFRAGDLVST